MQQVQRWSGRIGYVLTNILVIIILHGNSKQFWPKIPYLSLRNESTAEHTRLLFNTLALVTGGQALLGRLPRRRWLPRAIILGAIPASLPALIFFGQRLLRLEGTDDAQLVLGRHTGEDRHLSRRVAELLVAHPVTIKTNRLFLQPEKLAFNSTFFDLVQQCFILREK